MVSTDRIVCDKIEWGVDRIGSVTFKGLFDTITTCDIHWHDFLTEI